jgi:hypothetical protein
MLFADVLRASGRIDPPLTSLDHTTEIVHDTGSLGGSMQDPRSDFQP